MFEGVSSKRPVIAYQELDPEATLWCSFTAVADIWFIARRYAEQFANEDGRTPDAQATFMERAEAIVTTWFSRNLNVIYADEEMCRDWVDIAGRPLPDERATHEHVWMVAAAEALTKSRFSTTIVCEEARVYRAFKVAGYLNEIEILSL